jgi:hypothetical protein
MPRNYGGAIIMGHINNFLVHMVEKHHGSDGVLRLLTLAGISKKENQPEVVYSEEEFQALYNAAKELYGVGDKVAQSIFRLLHGRFHP